MSTEFHIKTNDLKNAGVGFKESICDITDSPITLINFPGYKYWREAYTFTEEGKEITGISCGGMFRAWLVDFLKDNKISYEEF